VIGSPAEAEAHGHARRLQQGYHGVTVDMAGRPTGAIAKRGRRKGGPLRNKKGLPETWFPAAFMMSDFSDIGLYARNP